MKTAYQVLSFRSASLEVIEKADSICQEYARQGYDLTLRQLYYQFVARGYIENKDTEYKRLGSIINDARLAGLLDWDYIEDRTRNLASLSHWSSPSDIVEACANQFRYDLWQSQPWYVECWVEKEALAGVVQRACQPLDVPHFSCRGYVSQSEMHAAALRLVRNERQGKETLIIHLGDHDPSGIDMTRDIKDRLRLFGSNCHIIRIALNMDQVEQFNPPPNPAKLTDSRCSGYIDRFGDESWELDALDPSTLNSLIQTTINGYIDQDLFDSEKARQAEARATLKSISERWMEIEASYGSRMGGEGTES